MSPQSTRWLHHFRSHHIWRGCIKDASWLRPECFLPERRATALVAYWSLWPIHPDSPSSLPWCVLVCRRALVCRGREKLLRVHSARVGCSDPKPHHVTFAKEKKEAAAAPAGLVGAAGLMVAAAATHTGVYRSPGAPSVSHFRTPSVPDSGTFSQDRVFTGGATHVCIPV